MKLDIWVRYGRLGASSRLRYYQYQELLAQQDIYADIHNFFDDEYLQALYAGKKRPVTGVVNSYRRRWNELRSASSGVPALIEYELLPFLPFCMEKGYLKKHPYILNFDDAVDLHYRQKRFLREKYPLLLLNAAGVIVANDVLYQRFYRFNPNIIKIPTVPPDSIKPGSDKPQKLTLVWTGTPVTYQYLYERKKAFQLAAEKVDYELLIVAAEDLPAMEGVNCRYIKWSGENEAAALARAHAGVMPLPETDFARGKSAYKLICFLRAGIPGIASPVGENCKVIENGVNGFLVSSDEKWAESIVKLADDRERAKLACGAANSAKKYDLSDTAQKLAAFIKSTFTQK
ncbi:MAG: glycosyltransferase [Lentisphaeria bacterium]|nr:glycosyltransferase [Lentisphaeria bacterium]